MRIEITGGTCEFVKDSTAFMFGMSTMSEGLFRLLAKCYGISDDTPGYRDVLKHIETHSYEPQMSVREFIVSLRKVYGNMWKDQTNSLYPENRQIMSSFSYGKDGQNVDDYSTLSIYLRGYSPMKFFVGVSGNKYTTEEELKSLLRASYIFKGGDEMKTPIGEIIKVDDSSLTLNGEVMTNDSFFELLGEHNKRLCDTDLKPDEKTFVTFEAATMDGRLFADNCIVRPISNVAFVSNVTSDFTTLRVPVIDGDKEYVEYATVPNSAVKQLPHNEARAVIAEIINEIGMKATSYDYLLHCKFIDEEKTQVRTVFPKKIKSMAYYDDYEVAFKKTSAVLSVYKFAAKMFDNVPESVDSALVAAGILEPNVEILKGHDISVVYDRGEVVDNGTMGSSCMLDKEEEYDGIFDLFYYNEAVMKTAIIRDSNGYIAARAHMWYLTDKRESTEGFWMMDRIYYASEKWKNQMLSYAVKRNIPRLRNQSYGLTVAVDNDENFLDLAEYRIELDEWDLSTYPYMDTWNILDRTAGFLTVNKEMLRLTSTEGEWYDMED